MNQEDYNYEIYGGTLSITVLSADAWTNDLLPNVLSRIFDGLELTEVEAINRIEIEQA